MTKQRNELQQTLLELHQEVQYSTVLCIVLVTAAQCSQPLTVWFFDRRHQFARVKSELKVMTDKYQSIRIKQYVITHMLARTPRHT